MRVDLVVTTFIFGLPHYTHWKLQSPACSTAPPLENNVLRLCTTVMQKEEPANSVLTNFSRLPVFYPYIQVKKSAVKYSLKIFSWSETNHENFSIYNIYISYFLTK